LASDNLQSPEKAALSSEKKGKHRLMLLVFGEGGFRRTISVTIFVLLTSYCWLVIRSLLWWPEREKIWGFGILITTIFTPPREFEWFAVLAVAVLVLVNAVAVRWLAGRFSVSHILVVVIVIPAVLLFGAAQRYTCHRTPSGTVNLFFGYDPFWGFGLRDIGLEFVSYNVYTLFGLLLLVALIAKICRLAQNDIRRLLVVNALTFVVLTVVALRTAPPGHGWTNRISHDRCC